MLTFLSSVATLSYLAPVIFKIQLLLSVDYILPNLDPRGTCAYLLGGTYLTELCLCLALPQRGKLLVQRVSYLPL